ncbi:DUF4846 domain-containing protein [Paramaledivibacter caminithermalis]|jgi:hypothetical protein|uniref:Lipoprotein n=1 Tax=Paramaledivibacter caminithermalis (strain DSM 15212 / CIP 107654 / DViRD3) TaxID=1121301 RepID=A0A1M6Q302_PARC5|nr:DUF4846 domain-containing protein [Paramaledivibacter caminithermalis]SHK14497.1 protein of unknown function (4846) [Paramaledivibacter caminithermalis DSM 15212]
MKKLICLILILSILTGCGINEQPKNSNIDVKDDLKQSITVQEKVTPRASIINEDAMVLIERFQVPEGYERIEVGDGSFAQYLRNLTLKPHGSKVLYYDGSIKKNYEVYEAVVDMDIGKKNLQQCADAIMRLRGEYLYSRGEYDKIHFNLTNGFRVDYSKWIEGYRVGINGNNASYIKEKQKSNTYKDFLNYMELIFMYAGTLSLSQELETVELMDMEIGDVFIQGGSPGHAVIVVDMAKSNNSDKKLFMLAQSYMPAQDIQILSNLSHDAISPWYHLDDADTISTPEWSFTKNDLKRFK